MTPKPERLSDAVTLYEGDSLEVMRSLPSGSAHSVMTDPPYTAAGGSTNGRSGGHSADSQFFLYWLRDVVAEITRVVRPDGCGFLFCDWRTVGVMCEAFSPARSTSRGTDWKVSQALVWDRECIGLGSPFRNSFEMLVFVRGPDWKTELPKNLPTVIRHRYPYGQHVNHGAEKPVELCKQLIRWSCPEAGIVFDPFAGSGTGGLAAEACGRKAVLIEMESDYCEIIRRRVREADGAAPGTLFREVARRESLFADEPEPEVATK